MGSLSVGKGRTWNKLPDFSSSLALFRVEATFLRKNTRKQCPEKVVYFEKSNTGTEIGKFVLCGGAFRISDALLPRDRHAMRAHCSKPIGKKEASDRFFCARRAVGCDALIKKRTRPSAKVRARPRAPGSEKKKEEGKGSSRARRLGDDLTGAARGDYIYSGVAYVCKYDIAHFDGSDHVSPADGIHCLRLQR